MVKPKQSWWISVGVLVSAFSLVENAQAKNESVIRKIDRNPAIRTNVLILAKGNDVLLEEYANGYSGDQLHRLWSITKSVGSLGLGFAVKDQRLKLTDSICDYLNESDGVTPAHCAIALEDLVFWQSGIQWTETDFGVRPDRSHLFHGLYGRGRADFAKYILSLPITNQPGSQWKYTTAESHLLWKILAKVYNRFEYENLLQHRLLEPLEIQRSSFEQDQSGIFLGGSHLYLSGRDLLKVARFVIKEYHQSQSLPDGWMQEMTTPRPNAVYSRWSDRRGETPAIGAGQWWSNRVVSSQNQVQPWVEAPVEAFAAFGVFGQMMIILPKEEIVIIRLGNDLVGSLLNRSQFVHEMLEEVEKRSLKKEAKQ